MKRVLMLTGDVNLMNVTDPQCQITRRCDTLGTTLTISGSEMIVWR